MKAFILALSVVISVLSAADARACSCGGRTAFIDYFTQYNRYSPVADRMAAVVETRSLFGMGGAVVKVIDPLKGTFSGAEIKIHGQDGGNCAGPVRGVGETWIVALEPSGFRPGEYEVISCAESDLSVEADPLTGEATAVGFSPLGEGFSERVALEELRSAINATYTVTPEELSCSLEIQDQLLATASSAIGPKVTVAAKVNPSGVTTLTLSAGAMITSAPFVSTWFDDEIHVSVTPNASSPTDFDAAISYVDFETLITQNWSSPEVYPLFRPEASKWHENLGQYLKPYRFNISPDFDSILRSLDYATGAPQWFFTRTDGTYGTSKNPATFGYDATAGEPHLYIRELRCRLSYKTTRLP